MVASPQGPHALPASSPRNVTLRCPPACGCPSTLAADAAAGGAIARELWGRAGVCRAAGAPQAATPHRVNATQLARDRLKRTMLPEPRRAGYPGMHKHSAAVIGITLGLVAWTNTATAICGRPPDVSFVPYGDDSAPLNTHERITLVKTWRTQPIACSGALGTPAAGACKPARMVLVLRTAPVAGKPMKEVPTDVRESVSAEIATVELVPRTLLAPNTRYDVWHEAESDAHTRRVVATFVTSDITDLVPPNFRGIKSAHRVTSALECETDGVVVSVWAATDSVTPAAQLRYGVWVPQGDATIDYNAPPTLIVAAETLQGRIPDPSTVQLSLGAGALPDLAVPKGARTLRLGIRALDLAGNASPASETMMAL